MRKKITAKQLSAMKKQGAKVMRHTEEVKVAGFDELLKRLDAFEKVSLERSTAQLSLMKALESMVLSTSETTLDLTPITEMLQRIESIGGVQQAPDYDFTFKFKSDGRYDAIRATAVPPIKH